MRVIQIPTRFDPPNAGYARRRSRAATARRCLYWPGRWASLYFGHPMWRPSPHPTPTQRERVLFEFEERYPPDAEMDLIRGSEYAGRVVLPDGYAYQKILSREPFEKRMLESRYTAKYPPIEIDAMHASNLNVLILGSARCPTVYLPNE